MLELILATTLFLPQHNEVIASEYEWVEIQGRLFKKPKGAPVTDHYWLREIQIFIDQFGREHIHIIDTPVTERVIYKGA